MIELVHSPRAPSGGTLPGIEVVPDSLDRMVGPFALLASIGPVDVPRGIPRDADARPHPHIGMGVLVYLKAGELTHRDNLGNVHCLRAGEASFMNAGREIVHSERLETLRAEGGRVQALLAFLALPENAEQAAPDWRYLPPESIPVVARPGAIGRLLLGRADGAVSPVPLPSPAMLIEWTLEPGATLVPQSDHEERGILVVSGELLHAGRLYGSGELLTLVPASTGVLKAHGTCEVVEFGGAPVGARYKWWNYLASDIGLIEAAKQRWLAPDRSLPPGETEFTPLPANHERTLQRLMPGASAAAAPEEAAA